jgi:phosphocarrier protein HPr
MQQSNSESSSDPSSENGCVHPGMSRQRAVARRQVEIINRLGLHLRAADQFVRLARPFQCEIRVHYQGKACNGKSILELMTLAAECGTRLELEACGPDAVAAVEALAVVVAAGFYQDENEREQSA